MHQVIRFAAAAALEALGATSGMLWHTSFRLIFLRSKCICKPAAALSNILPKT